MFDILLQVDSIGTTIKNSGQVESVWSLLSKGGPLMIPLGILFALAVFFFIERLMAVNKAAKIDENFMRIIRDHIITGNVTAARSLAKNTDNPVARMIDKGIQRIGKPIENIERSMENVGKLEIYNLERNLSILSLSAGTAPLLGFLGTIIGMFQLFYSLATGGDFTIQNMANGIYTKVMTSATGLIIGLLAYVAHNFLTTQVDKTAYKMEASSAEFLDVLQEPTR